MYYWEYENISLERHELKIVDRGVERKIDQSLQAQVDMKGDREKNNWRKGNLKEERSGLMVRISSRLKASPPTPPHPTPPQRRIFIVNNRKKKEYDKRNIQCFNYEQFVHYVDE